MEGRRSKSCRSGVEFLAVGGRSGKDGEQDPVVEFRSCSEMLTCCLVHGICLAMMLGGLCLSLISPALLSAAVFDVFVHGGMWNWLSVVGACRWFSF